MGRTTLHKVLGYSLAFIKLVPLKIKDDKVHSSQRSKRFDSALKIDDGMKRNTKKSVDMGMTKVQTSTSTCLFRAIPRLATRKLFILVSPFANDR